MFIQTLLAKELRKPALLGQNVEKTKAAPATAIVAANLEFYENIPRLFSTRPEMRDMFTGADKELFVREFGRDNAFLQMGYFMIAARAVGLDIGPIGGFDRAKVDAAFFRDGKWISLYLINVSHADHSKSFPRLARGGSAPRQHRHRVAHAEHRFRRKARKSPALVSE